MRLRAWAEAVAALVSAGLGKTLQALAVYVHLRHFGGPAFTGKPVIIVCPLSVIGSWVGQCMHFLGAVDIMQQQMQQQQQQQEQQVEGGTVEAASETRRRHEPLRLLAFVGDATTRATMQQQVFKMQQQQQQQHPEERGSQRHAAATRRRVCFSVLSSLSLLFSLAGSVKPVMHPALSS